MRETGASSCWTDALGERDAVASLVAALVRHSAPKHVVVVRIRDWFGPNWFQFAGKVLGATGVHRERVEDAAIPPFVPERVVAEGWWGLDADGAYTPRPPSATLHIQQQSERNMHRLRKASHVLGEGTLAIWFGRGGSPERISILAIDTCGEAPDSWYAEGELTEGRIAWGKCVGVAHRDLEAMEVRDDSPRRAL